MSSDNDSTERDAMGEEDKRERYAQFGSDPSWYWSDHHGRHVLIEDGETTTDDLAAQRAEGWGDPVAEADYWVMVASMTVDAAARRVTQAREADAESPTFDNLLLVTDAERAYGDAVTIHDAMLDAADDARAHETSERAHLIDIARDAERHAMGDAMGEVHPASEKERQDDLDNAWRLAVTITHAEGLIEYGNDGPYESDRSLPTYDRNLRDYVIAHIAQETGVSTGYLKKEILDTVHDYFRAHGTDDDPDFFAPPNWDDLTHRAWENALSAEATRVYETLFDNPRNAELFGGGLAGDDFSDHLWEAAEGIAGIGLTERGAFPPGRGDNPPGVTTDPLADDAAATWEAARYHETRPLYDELFDHDKYARVAGDGRAEDSYSDLIWAAATWLAEERLADRGLLPPTESGRERGNDTDGELHRPDTDGRLDLPATATTRVPVHAEDNADEDGQHAWAAEYEAIDKAPADGGHVISDGQAQDSYSSQLGESDDHWSADQSELDESDYTRAQPNPDLDDEKSATTERAWDRDADTVATAASPLAAWEVSPPDGRADTRDELQARLDALRARVSHGATPEGDERGGESPGKPGAAEAVAQAHAAVLASEPTAHPTPAVAGERVAEPHRFDDTGAGL
ncbi:MAG: hypothetical protein ACRDQ4_14110 [Pseudonocardiaceae bacterium]